MQTMKSEYNSSQLTAHSSSQFVFINYANEQYKYQQKFALWAAKKAGGFDEVIAYSPESLDENFRNNHKEILNVKRGNGLWLWKPYIILDALNRVNDGDYVFYSDSGAFFFSRVMPVIESMGESDIWVSDITCVEEQWTKPEVFKLLGIDDREDIKKSRQIQSGFVLCRKSETSIKFINEWLNLCSRPELITPLKKGEYKGTCIEHREDQSMLSVLCKIHNIKAHMRAHFVPLHHVPSITNIVKTCIKLPVKQILYALEVYYQCGY